MTTKTVSALPTAPRPKIDPPPYKPSFQLIELPSPGGFTNKAYMLSSLKDIEYIDQQESSPAYLVLALEEVSTTEKIGASTKTSKSLVPGLYKRIRNISGNCLVRVSDTDLTSFGFGKITSFMNFDLPRMPEEFLNKIVQFFHDVYDKHHTESIVILAYDREYLNCENDYDGWIVLVPDQSNTAGDCKYEPESIMNEKNDSTLIVGTIHSHPNMSAFASSTDAHDQMDNDGLHITVGWKADGPPEYYVEFQMSNVRHRLEISDVVDYAPKAQYDTSSWVSKVKKQIPTYPMQASKGISQTSFGGSTHQSIGGGTTSIYTRLKGEYYRNQHNSKRAQGCPDIVRNVVIARIADDENSCPVCDANMEVWSRRNRRCISCFTYLLTMEDGDNLNKIAENRKSAYANNVYLPGLEFLENPSKAVDSTVLLWDRFADKKIIMIKAPEKKA